MIKCNENTRVQVPAALHLCKLGYTYLDNISDSDYEHNTNIIIDIFLRSVKRLNPELSDLECKQQLDKIVDILKYDDLGREFYSFLSSNSGIKLIDFNDIKNNEWHITTEFECVNQDTDDRFRPDITCFVNGLPLAFIEVKKPNNHDGILAERDRINKRMRNKSFRRFFNITQLMIFSNNQEYDNDNRVPIQGAFYCCTSKDKAFFNVFREADKTFIETFDYLEIESDLEKKIFKHRNCVGLDNIPEYNTNKNISTPTNRIITSMLSRERFLYLLRYGIVYVNKTIELEDGTKTTEQQKHIMRYQQFFALLSIRKKLNLGVKSGIIWHTQGSGKTALSYYSIKALTDFYANKNIAVKFYFIVDRIALMEQAIDEFAARDLIVRTANSRDELMKDIGNNTLVENDNGQLEIMVVNIQKFKDDSTKVKIDNTYSTKLQRIFFIDEAHRGYNPQGSFLANLLEADKDAIKIALTGTPLLKEERESWRVFGDYIDTYYYDKSISDGYTLKLMREPIETIYKEKIEDILEKLAGNVDVKRSDIDKNKIIEHKSYLNELLNYIIDDIIRFRKEHDDNTVGAMIVCKTNNQAREMYKLWQERYDKCIKLKEKKETETTEEGIMSKYQEEFIPLKASLILHDEGDKKERKAYIDEYKKKLSVDVLIVNQMLLTGFDAPRLKKLYLGRSLDGHDLLQALTRVNRPYKDFKYGYVVDFVDIKENFESTNDRYLRELNRTTDIDEVNQEENVGNVIIVDKDEILKKISEIKSVLFNFTCDNIEDFRQEIDEIDNKENLYQVRTVLTEAKSLINQVRAFGDNELKEKITNILNATTIPTLITEVNHRIERINLLDKNENQVEVSSIINLVLSELEFEFKKGLSEEMKIIINDIRERCERVQAEFEANFDKKEDKFVNLANEFREYFRERGFVPQSTHEAKESIMYMEEVMKKIKEINRRNNTLKKKYNGDERFARVHKRITEENQTRNTPIISKEEYEIALKLACMKTKIDEKILLNVNILDNEDAFKQDVLAIIGGQLLDLSIKTSIQDRKYINNLITTEYFQQHNYA